MKIIFATNNQHKIDEISAAVPDNFEFITLKEAGIDIEIPEPHQTLEENAREKAKTIFRITQTACFSEDTGLEVEALNGEPGVQSAHYAGDRSAAKNIEKLLQKLEGKLNRNARFRTVICLVLKEDELFFEGICTGRITEAMSGKEGFGYDPVFIPDGSDKTFAEMSIQEKNSYSHRRKAVDKLVAFLKQLNQKP